MNTVSAPRNLPPATNAEMADRHHADEEIPPGWESANPALQIERWLIEEREQAGRSC